MGQRFKQPRLLFRTNFERKFISPVFWLKTSLCGKSQNKEEGKNEEVTILMRDFYEPYGRQRIERDRQQIISIKRHLSAEPLSFARRQELLVLDGIINDGWLGKNILASEASEYDDLRNGFDIIVTIRDLASLNDKIFVIDLTTARKPEVVKNKLLARKCATIGFSNINYYSNGEDFIRKTSVPRFIVGTNSEFIVAANKELRLNARGVRTSNFARLSFEIRESIITQILTEILLEIELFKTASENSDKAKKMRRLEELEPIFWSQLIANINRRVKNKNFPKTVLKQNRFIHFRRQQRAILDYLGFGCDRKENGTSELIIETTKQLCNNDE